MRICVFQPDANIACALEVVGTVTGPRSVAASEVSYYPEWEGLFGESVSAYCLFVLILIVLS